MISRIYSMRASGLISLVILFVAVPALDALGGGVELLAGSSDSEIREILQPLLPISKAQLDDLDEDVGVVLTHRAFETDGSSRTEVQDKVWWVRRGEAEDVTNFVLDFRPGVEVKEVVAFLIRPGGFEISRVLEADIERLAADRIHLSKGGGNSRQTNLVIGFDTAQPGDLIGVSIRTYEKRPLSWKVWVTAEEEPVARAELRLKCNWERTFAVFGSRFPQGKMNREILEQKDGQITDLRIWADSINPVRREPYAPPTHLQSPQIIIAWRATKVRMNKGMIWVYNENWNQVAVRMSEIHKRFMKKTKQTASQAGKVSLGLKSREAADALYRFVRDDLLDLDSSLYYDKDNTPTVDEIIKGRSGSDFEKAYVLLAMLLSQNFDADLVWAHDPESGNYFEKYPSWGQMSEPLVRVKDAQGEYWYDLNCEGCLPGVIRSKLGDTEALEYLVEAHDLDDRLWDKAMAEAQGRFVDPYRHYMDQMKKKPWSKLIRTPRQSGKWAGWSEEIIVFGSETGKPEQARLNLKSVGRTPFQNRVDDKGNVSEAGESWALSRYPEVSDATVLETSSPGADTLSLELDLECSPLVVPMGDNWILPPEMVFGDPVVESWPENRLTDFHVPRNTHRCWVFRVPLPDGWEDAVLPANHICLADNVMYQIKYEIDNGDFLVTRKLVEQAGYIRSAGKITEIGTKLATINDLETSPVILTKKSIGP